MKDAKSQLNALIEKGISFTYENFSSKGQYGYPEARTSEWVGWVARVQSVTRKLFGENSPQDKMVDQALRIRVIGNGPDKFDECKNYLLGALNNAVEIINNDVFNEVQVDKKAESRLFGNKVFIVHGHDEEAKISVARFIEKLGLEAIILHEQPNKGKTIIEKFEEHASISGFSIVILTPDDVGYEQNDIDNAKPRARQNVIFELGYFCGILGRQRVSVLFKEGVEIPTDYVGIVYTKFDSEGAWKLSIAKEMKVAGLEFDMNKVFA